MVVSFEYDKSVFINCPFDRAYKPLLDAIVFAVFDCGFRPRCALEIEDGGQVRMEKRPLARRSRCCHESAWRFVPSQCRDAPWGVSEAERTVRNLTARPRGAGRSEVAADFAPSQTRT
jgi:hypothetical protein